MNDGERKVVNEALLTEIDFWKFKTTGLYKEGKVDKGIYVPDFMLLNEARRVMGRLLRDDETEKVMEQIKKFRISRRARFEDFNQGA